MSICVEDVMVRDVVTVDSEYSVKYAARMMKYFGISSVVAVSEGKIAGILTEKDVLTRVVARGLDPEKVMVKEVMSCPVIVVSPSTQLEEAVKIMLRRQIKKLPVVRRGETGLGLLGMLSLTDVARLQPKMMEVMKELLAMSARASEETADFYVR